MNVSQLPEVMQVSASCCAPGTLISNKQSTDVAALFKALSHPVRVKMLDIIRSAEDSICVCDVEANFDLSQPTISHHLKILRDAGFIESEQRGLWVYHRIRPEAFEKAQQFLASFA